MAELSHCVECGNKKHDGSTRYCSICLLAAENAVPTFEARGRRIGRLVDEKNKAYGDSFAKSGQVLALMYPDGIAPDQYRDALAIVRIIDKLFRIATSKDAFGEDPFQDIAGYGIVAGTKEEAA